MKKVMMVVVLALAGCTGISRSVASQRDPLAGHWMGVIDRDGWQRPLWVDIAAKDGAYDGSWMSLENQPGVMVDRVNRSSDAVRIELASLVFDGRLSGRTLVGDVAQRDGGARVGSFTLTRIDPERPVSTP